MPKKRLLVPEPADVDLVIRITSLWQPDGVILKYEMESPSDVIRPHDRVFYSQPVNSLNCFGKDLIGEIEELRKSRASDGEMLLSSEVDATIEEIGHNLYDRLFPLSMKEAYHRFRDDVESLIVVSNEPWIPWELVKSSDGYGDDFFCLQFKMSRWFASAGDPVITKGIQRWVSISAGGVDQNRLLKVPSETEILSDILAGCFGATFVDPSHSEVIDVIRQCGFDLLHFVGHCSAGHANSDLAKISLADRCLRARELHGPLVEEARRVRPIVFLNCCEGGRLGRAITGLGGWAQRWVETCGASVFLAPMWLVDDTAACEMAAIFYRKLQEGQPLGDALRGARREIRISRSGSLDWLAYTLYGHPNLRVVLGESVLETASIKVVNSPLYIPHTSWRPERSPVGALLQPAYDIVPFHLRTLEFESLDNWCNSGSTLGIWLYTGAGGTGKTRLALEICRRRRVEGWQAGLVDPDLHPEEIWRRLQAFGGPRLLVIDYAESQRRLLIALLREIYKAEENAPIRVLLLARAALDWWVELKAEGHGVGELLTGPATQWHTLQPLALSVADRAESYRNAAAAFAEKLGRPVPEELPDDLEGDHYERAILLHMRALAAIDGVGVKGIDSILDYILNRERRFWRRSATERKLPVGLWRGIGQAMAAITLAGGVEDIEEAILVIRRLLIFRNEKESILAEVARLLREIYPGNRHWIEPVMPDILGQHLIELEIGDDFVRR